MTGWGGSPRHFRSRPVWGWGWPRPRLRAPSSCRPPGPRSCQMARYPRTTPPFRRPLCPSCRVGFAPIPTKSGESRASVWILRSGPSELVDQGQHIEVSAGHVDQLGTLVEAGHVHQLQALGLGRTRRAGVGAIVGAASRAGRERLRGSSPPRSTEGRFDGRGETMYHSVRELSPF